MDPYTFSGEFRKAAVDYRYLLEGGYPEKPVLKLVGDRFRLSRIQRQVLYRGIDARERSALRSEKRREPAISDTSLYVDGYNVLFTIYNYLSGRQLFICDDGFLRDTGELRGRISNKPVFNTAVELLIEYAARFDQLVFQVFLDEPVSHSGRLAADISKQMMEKNIPGEAVTVPTADTRLSDFDDDLIATSDSAIIDRHRGPVFDLARSILDTAYQPNFPRLALLLDQ